MTINISCVNWPEQFPYCPLTSVDIDNDKEYLYLHYHVEGKQLRALALNDQEPVWEDSCVEFFCRVPGDDRYMNIETNCIGTVVASRRLSRNDDVRPLSPDELQSIRRRTSLPHERIDERDGDFSWDVELDIPLTLIFGGQPLCFPLTLMANFYKCADKTKLPHFVSWQPIDLPKPDFHCPQFFAPVELH